MKHKCPVCEDISNEINMFYESGEWLCMVCYDNLNNYRCDNECVNLFDAIKVLKRANGGK